MIALTAAQAGWFLFEIVLIFAGLFVIAVLTPKLAAFIDKKRAQNKSPYESAPLPERVEDSTDKPDGASPSEAADESAQNSAEREQGSEDGSKTNQDSGEN